MDLAFSSDDYLFATASGDQSARVIDMGTQQTRFVMQAHTSSVKQVRFQPGNDSIVATSNRDGSVMIWDLWCRGQNASVADFSKSFQPGNHMTQSRNPITYVSSVNTMRDAHGVTKVDGSRRSYVSITALSFLPDSRSNLLLTSSEADSSVKLWDLRANYTSRRDGLAIPVSGIRVPDAHKVRPYGISSVALNGDGSRFYALCRDSTVYAYSTNHLITGHAPELDLPTTSQASHRFRPGSFYVRAALRPATSSGPEMLAVGRRDGCAVLFPTDEALLRKPSYRPTALAHDSDVEDEHDSELPRRRSRPSMSVKYQPSTLPIYTQGAALVRAHGNSEVTGLIWTSEGELVTKGDDFSAKCWREKDPNAAREMRLCGEGKGARHEWGWAEVDGCDEEEG
jgi:WD40 repeat protein